MSQRRAHPLARREDELLQAALDASKREGPAPPPLLPPTPSSSSSSAAPAAAPTRYGTLHGTLGTVTSAESLGQVAGGAHRPALPAISPPEVLTGTGPHLPTTSSSAVTPAAAVKTLVFPTDPTIHASATDPIRPDLPTAVASPAPGASTSESDPIVSLSTLPPGRPTMATEAISSFSSASRWGEKNPLAAAATPLGPPPPPPPIRGVDEREVVDDSDGEGGCSSSLSISSASLALGPPPPHPFAAGRSSSPFRGELTHPVSLATSGSGSGSRGDQARPSTDPIVGTESSASLACGPLAATKATTAAIRPLGDQVSVEIPVPPARRSTSINKAQKRARTSTMAAATTAASHGAEGEAIDRVATPDALPAEDHKRAGKTKARAKKVNRTIVQSSEDEDEDEDEDDGQTDGPDVAGGKAETIRRQRSAPVSRSSPDPLAAPLISTARGSAGSSAPSRSHSIAAVSETSRRGTHSIAISDDESGEADLRAISLADAKREEERNSDFEEGAKRRRKSGTKKAPSRKGSVAEGGKEKRGPKRRSTVSKDPGVMQPGAEPSGVVAEPNGGVQAVALDDDTQGGTRPQETKLSIQHAMAADDGEDETRSIATSKKKPSKRKRTIADSDDDEEGHPAVEVQADPSLTGSTPKPGRAAKASRKGSVEAASSALPAKRGRRAAAAKNAFCPSSEVEPEHAQPGEASDATSAIRTEDEDAEVSASELTVGRQSKKSRTMPNAVGPGRPRKRTSTGASGPPDVLRDRTASVEARVEQMMRAAQGSPEQSLASLPANTKSTEAAAEPRLHGNSKGYGKGRTKRASQDDTDADDEEDEDEEEPRQPRISPGDAKENNSAATPAPSRTSSVSRLTAAATPVRQQRAQSSSETPVGFRKPPKPRSLAAIIAKKGIVTTRSPGLSVRQKIPRLHTNLQPPPPAKKMLQEKPKKPKKGEESYSDEEKPWYERKHPEEWDDDDHRRWQRRCKRIERGLPPDSPTKDD